VFGYTKNHRRLLGSATARIASSGALLVVKPLLGSATAHSASAANLKGEKKLLSGSTAARAG
jgi:hypothetical protein